MDIYLWLCFNNKKEYICEQIVLYKVFLAPAYNWLVILSRIDGCIWPIVFHSHWRISFHISQAFLLGNLTCIGYSLILQRLCNKWNNVLKGVEKPGCFDLIGVPKKTIFQNLNKQGAKVLHSRWTAKAIRDEKKGWKFFSFVLFGVWTIYCHSLMWPGCKQAMHPTLLATDNI